MKKDKQINNKTYLFSIDLEDARLGVVNGSSYENRVAVNTHKYLAWLTRYNAKCTFFSTGHVAKLCPSLIKEIVDEGHEIACHTTNHVPLDKQTPEKFKQDIEKNIFLLTKAGAKEIKGFRAPVFSLTKETQWAYSVLEELGFIYSSSVLPAKNPLYGWEDFSEHPKIYKNNIFEIPVTISKLGHLRVPSSGGVYFRVLPFFIIKNMINKSQRNSPLVGYFHPYDLDTEQEKFMHAGINNSKFYNFLMYYNRNNVIKRLDYLMENQFEICTYASYVKSKLK